MRLRCVLVMFVIAVLCASCSGEPTDGGDAGDANYQWLRQDGGFGPESCDVPMRLYCIDGQ